MMQEAATCSQVSDGQIGSIKFFFFKPLDWDDWTYSLLTETLSN